MCWRARWSAWPEQSWSGAISRSATLALQSGLKAEYTNIRVLP
jgi:hypothetical protein